MEIVFEKVFSEHLENISLQIETGKIIGITGRGKTALLKMLSYNMQVEGEATYKEYDYNYDNLYKIRKKINLIEKDFENKFSVSTVEEYIAIWIRYYKIEVEEPNRKITFALKMVGLTEEYLKRDLFTLSSSEKKLLQIALSLLSNPKVILLDEPFIKLDMKYRKKIERLLIKLKERYHKTIIIASNDSESLYNITEQMIFLKNKKILKQGETKNLYQNIAFLTRNHYDIPDIVLFTHKAKEQKNVKIDYHKDIRDLIKDIYKHV